MLPTQKMNHELLIGCIINVCLMTDHHVVKCHWTQKTTESEVLRTDPSAQGIFGHSLAVPTSQPAAGKHWEKQSGKGTGASLCPHCDTLLT